MKLANLLGGSMILVAFVVVGCSQGPDDSPGVAQGPTIDGSKFVLADEPQGAAEVIAARDSARDAEEVVVVGRIGGSHQPWVEGVAAFSIVDSSLEACSDVPGDECRTPWDYCCVTPQLKSSTALVKLVDADGQVVKSDARGLLHLKELQTVVVRGQAQRDDAGNLTVLATGVHVRE